MAGTQAIPSKGLFFALVVVAAHFVGFLRAVYLPFFFPKNVISYLYVVCSEARLFNRIIH